MSQRPDDVPPWGTPDDGAPAHGTPPRNPEPRTPGPRTPDPRTSEHGAGGEPDYGTPDYGTPAPAPGRAPSPDPAATGWGAPVGGPDVLTADTVVVVERGGFMSAGGYALTTAQDVPLGSLLRETSAAGFIFGGAATTTYRLLDVRDQVIGSMQRPGTLGRSRFVVTGAHGGEVGTVEQENSFGAPQLLLTTADQLVMRLSGGRWGSREWQLVDGLDESVLMGQVSQEYAGLGGMINDTQRFAVQLSPQLVGDHRLLAVMATVCLDYIRDAKVR
jgi:hypothetical protein